MSCSYYLVNVQAVAHAMTDKRRLWVLIQTIELYSGETCESQKRAAATVQRSQIVCLSTRRVRLRSCAYSRPDAGLSLRQVLEW